MSKIEIIILKSYADEIETKIVNGADLEPGSFAVGTPDGLKKQKEADVKMIKLDLLIEKALKYENALKKIRTYKGNVAAKTAAKKALED